MRPEKAYASVWMCVDVLYVWVFMCLCVYVCVVWRQAQLWLQFLNRSRVLSGSAFKGSVSPWVKVVRYQMKRLGVMLLKGLL